jgi:FeS assembly SUF system protein
MDPTNAAAPSEAATPTPVSLEERIVDVIRTCYDPEIPVNIHELGLIYGIDVSESKAVTIRMTLTSPACPAAGSLPPEVERKVRGLADVTDVKVQVVWDPPWTPDRMTEAARLQLGLE